MIKICCTFCINSKGLVKMYICDIVQCDKCGLYSLQDRIILLFSFFKEQ